MALLSNKLQNLRLDDDESREGISKKGSSSKKTVDEKYQKLSPREHVLKRPDTYIGTCQRSSNTIWVWDEEQKSMVNREVTYPPGLYKIFDEILVNAADHAQRGAGMTTLKVDYERENNRISVYNNGSGIPIEWHKTGDCYVPELIFGHLHTSSNYDDTEEKVTGGRNGFGAKLCNIYSTEFIVETASSKDGKKYKQVFKENMAVIGDPQIKSVSKKEDWTKITFSPDLEKFEMDALDDDILAVIAKRVYDVAGCNSKLKVYLNGEKLPIKSFKDYIALYSKDIPVIYERFNDRWEVAIAPSDGQLTQVSFVNSICTLRGGKHVDNVADQVATRLGEFIAKKDKKTKVRPFQIKAQLSLYINCLITNPSFDSQTKETLTTRPSKFGSKWSFSDDLLKKVSKSEIVKNVLDFAKFKQNKELAKTDGSKSRGRVMGIPNLDDANRAGTKDASRCTLILTEGLSAKALVTAAFSVIGRDFYGCFPLRGKLLNVRDAKHKQVVDNTEISNLKKILGLKQNVKYDADTIKTLRYGHVLIMTDQDHDGSHIKGLLLNFFDHYWPGLLAVPGFLQEFITPIVKTWKKKEELLFYTQPEYTEWCRQNPSKAANWEAKYLKGLGGSDTKDAKNYFSDLPRHLLKFRYGGNNDHENIKLAFSKARAEDRKKWLANFEPGTFFNYGVDDLTYSNFVNKELILFSMADNARSIPSVCDGLKPSQRKVLWGAFKKKCYSQIKVGTLCGFVQEQALYHHGEASLQATIVGLAQTFVGSNNINLMFPGGMFGTRLQGGKDAASARYISTKLTKSARALFPAVDEPLLKSQEEEGKVIEPEWYCPIIPLVLVNGVEGIGTGWSTSIPNFNPRDVIKNIRRMIEGKAPVEMIPWYRGFKGTIVPVGNADSYDVHGILCKCEEENTLRVKELPVGSWTTPYKTFLESNAVGQADASSKPFIKDILDNGTEAEVCFTFTCTAEGYNALMKSGDVFKKLKLSSSVATSNMVLFDSDGRLRKYETTSEILQEFFEVRLDMYKRRKVHVLGELRLQALRLGNRARFIKMVIAREIIIGNRKKKDLIAELRQKKFDEIPPSKRTTEPTGDEESEDGESAVDDGTKGFDYLLSMPLWSLTKEKVDKLLKELLEKKEEIVVLENTTPQQLWITDLNNLDEVLNQNDKEAEELRKELAEAAAKERLKQAGKGKGGRKGKSKAPVYIEIDDGMDEEIAPPAARTKAARKPRKPKAEPKIEPKKEAKKEPVKMEVELVENVEEAAPLRKEVKSRKGKPAKVEGLIDDGDHSGNFESEFEEDEVYEASKPVKRTTARRAASKKVVIDDFDDEDGEDSDDYEPEEVVVKKATRSKLAKGKAGMKKKEAEVVDLEMDDVSSDDVEEVKEVKASKPAKPSKKAAPIDEEEEDEEEELNSEEEEEDEEDEVFMTPVKRPTKRRAASRARIVIDDEEDEEDDDDDFVDDDEEDDDDDFIVESPAVAKKKRAPRGAWKTPNKGSRKGRSGRQA